MAITNDEVGSDERLDLLRSSPLFGGLTQVQLEDVLSRCERRRIAAGEWCVQSGETSDGLYLVLYGRLQTHLPEGLGEQVSQGQVFGEIGVLTKTPRTAGVRAIRDTEVLFLPVDAFDRLASEHPEWLRRVAQVVVDRLVKPPRRPAEDRVLTIGVVAIGEVDNAKEISRGVATTLGEEGTSIVIDAADAPPLEDRASWANGLEDAHRYVVYDCVTHDDAWTGWCVRHSDRLLLVADSTTSPLPIPPPLAAGIEERTRSGSAVLVLLHPPSGVRPVPLGHRGGIGDVAVINVRRGNPRDLARAARLVAGRGVGLVLGGGGPRGFVHLGVMRALDEAGVPVDAIGGTSIGAVMGSFRALDLDADTRERWALSGLIERGNLFPPTLPLLSYSSARKVRELLESTEYLGDRLIEQTWIPFFCVSSNLTRAEVVVHDRGSLATAVRASLSLPGIFPPVRSGRDLLVDGGVLNNLPVDVMRQRSTVGPVVAVDLSVDVEVGALPSYRETPSGWSLLLDRIRRRTEGALPMSLSVLMRARELAGISAQRQLLHDCPPDLLVRPDLSKTSMFDFKGALHLIDVGRRAALEALEAWDRGGSPGADEASAPA